MEGGVGSKKGVVLEWSGGSVFRFETRQTRGVRKGPFLLREAY